MNVPTYENEMMNNIFTSIQLILKFYTDRNAGIAIAHQWF